MSGVHMVPSMYLLNHYMNKLANTQNFIVSCFKVCKLLVSLVDPENNLIQLHNFVSHVSGQRSHLPQFVDKNHAQNS